MKKSPGMFGLSGIALSLMFIAASPLYGQNNFDLDRLNSGEILVNLSADEQAQVEQDTLHAGLSYTAQGRDRIGIQDEVNSLMAEAQELLEETDLEFSIHQYRVYQVPADRSTRGNDNLIWRAQQSLQITSQDSAAVLEAVAELQGIGLTMNGLNYSLSNARREEVADSLMAAALAEVKTRAEAAAAELGKSGVEIIELTMNSGGGGGFYRSTAMSLEAARDVAVPVADPGLTTVSFNVSARVILLP